MLRPSASRPSSARTVASRPSSSSSNRSRILTPRLIIQPHNGPSLGTPVSTSSNGNNDSFPSNNHQLQTARAHSHTEGFRPVQGNPALLIRGNSENDFFVGSSSQPGSATVRRGILKVTSIGSASMRHQTHTQVETDHEAKILQTEAIGGRMEESGDRQVRRTGNHDERHSGSGATDSGGQAGGEGGDQEVVQSTRDKPAENPSGDSTGKVVCFAKDENVPEEPRGGSVTEGTAWNAGSSAATVSAGSSPPPYTSTHRTQGVRSHLEKYRIEQIALRRIRFVIDNDESTPDHLSMIELLDQSNVPAELIQKFFGPRYSNTCDVRVLLLRSIEKSKLRRSTPAHAFDNNPPRPLVTTPTDVLRAINSVESGRRYVPVVPLHRSRINSHKTLERADGRTKKGSKQKTRYAEGVGPAQYTAAGMGSDRAGTAVGAQPGYDDESLTSVQALYLIEARRKKAARAASRGKHKTAG